VLSHYLTRRWTDPSRPLPYQASQYLSRFGSARILVDEVASSVPSSEDQPRHNSWFSPLRVIVVVARRSQYQRAMKVASPSAQIQRFVLLTLILSCTPNLTERTTNNIFASEPGQCRPFDRVRRSANIDIAGIVPHCSSNASIGRSRWSLR